MKFASSIGSIVLILSQINTPLISATEVVENKILSPKIDTNVGSAFLKEEYLDGRTYLETAVMDQTTKVHLDGQDFGLEDSKMCMVEESEIAVSAIPGGGKKVEITYNHIGMSMTMMGQTQKYDSKNKSDKDSLFQDLLDHTITLEIDDDGTVVSASENEELLKSLSATTGKDSPATDLASSKRFEQIARMAKTLPEDPVKPGDRWDFDYSESNMVGFQGTAELLGYADHNGYSCAVIAMSGDIDLNMGGLEEVLEGQTEKEEVDGLSDVVAEVMQNMEVSDGRMEVTLYFDPEAKFVRWMEMSLTMIMTVQMGEDEMLMDIESLMKVGTRIKDE